MSTSLRSQLLSNSRSEYEIWREKHVLDPARQHGMELQMKLFTLLCALQDHLTRTAQAPTAIELVTGRYRVLYTVVGEPAVEIIIPTGGEPIAGTGAA